MENCRSQSESTMANPTGEEQRRRDMEACDQRGILLDGNDLISTLTDDVLLHILSFLTMKEAGGTSVLSKRWRYVWTYIPTLDFCSKEILDELWPLEGTDEAQKVEGLKYFNWVDQVVKTHKAPTIDEFRVGFPIANLRSNLGSIDKWFRFAMEKRVKMFEVDLSRLLRLNYDMICHTLPSLYFSDRLTSLELGCVDVTGEVLESLLRNCLALECLSVKYSTSLVELVVTGPSLKLKSLRVKCCDELKKLEIAAPNLVTLRYKGKPINVKLKSTPKLREVSLGRECSEDLHERFSDISSYVSQIEVLCLYIELGFQQIRMPDKDYLFRRLKTLELEVFPSWYEALDSLVYLIKASPLLHHFKLTVEHVQLEGADDRRRKELKPQAFPHHHLKIVEFGGFLGGLVDFEIATFLIDCAVSLDKFIVSLPDISYYEMKDSLFIRKTRRHHKAWISTIQLGWLVKPGTKLEIQ